MSETVNPRHMAGASCRRVLQAQCVGVYFQVDTNAKVNGIDILLVGPYDLNNGIGHPETGHSEPVSYNIADGRTTVPLRLEPWGTVFVVFRKATQETSRSLPKVGGV